MHKRRQIVNFAMIWSPILFWIYVRWRVQIPIYLPPRLYSNCRQFVCDDHQPLVGSPLREKIQETISSDGILTWEHLFPVGFYHQISSFIFQPWPRSQCLCVWPEDSHCYAHSRVHSHPRLSQRPLLQMPHFRLSLWLILFIYFFTKICVEILKVPHHNEIAYRVIRGWKTLSYFAFFFIL